VERPFGVEGSQRQAAATRRKSPAGRESCQGNLTRDILGIKPHKAANIVATTYSPHPLNQYSSITHPRSSIPPTIPTESCKPALFYDKGKGQAFNQSL
jgi:hypothetical protein